VYAPCSDATFRELAASFHLRSFPPRVRSQYIAAWRSIIRVVRYEKDRQKRRDMINYCRHRFRGCLALGNILPSRLVKRLVTTLISHFDAGDPWLNERLFYNETLASFLRSQTLQKALGRLPDGLSAEGIPDLRRALDLAELARRALAPYPHPAHPQLRGGGKRQMRTPGHLYRFRSLHPAGGGAFPRPAAHVPLHLRDGGRPCP